MLNRYLVETFSVDDYPHTLDKNLTDVVKLLSNHLKNNSNFGTFAAELLSDTKFDAKVIVLDKTKPKLEDKCLELLELWIWLLEGSKWQDLIEAARKSGFSGLASRLAVAFTAEFDSQQELQKQFTKRSEGERNYKICASSVATELVYSTIVFLCTNVHVIAIRY